MIVVSACLAGLRCKYDGSDNQHAKVIELVQSGKAIPVCPEQLGGLPTPRSPAEIKDDKVYTIDGQDVTEFLNKGALETLRLAQMINCRVAILKQRSPSCGCGQIYDGSHQSKLIPGNGVTTNLLLQNGIMVKSEEDL
jgi:uncharacterized protein YbbK (DUF523 family)